MVMNVMMALLLSTAPAVPAIGITEDDPTMVHPDHGASFLEQLSGQWVVKDAKGKEQKRLRFYEDGRFGFMQEDAWTAGSYMVLRSDERQKGVLRLEYYVDGNLHLQEVRVEVHFEAHTQGEHDHGQDGKATSGAEHQHEFLLVEVLPAVEQRLDMAGDYLHQH